MVNYTFRIIILVSSDGPADDRHWPTDAVETSAFVYYVLYSDGLIFTPSVWVN